MYSVKQTSLVCNQWYCVLAGMLGFPRKKKYFKINLELLWSKYHFKKYINKKPKQLIRKLAKQLLKSIMSRRSFTSFDNWHHKNCHRLMFTLYSAFLMLRQSGGSSDVKKVCPNGLERTTNFFFEELDDVSLCNPPSFSLSRSSESF